MENNKLKISGVEYEYGTYLVTFTFGLVERSQFNLHMIRMKEQDR